LELAKKKLQKSFPFATIQFHPERTTEVLSINKMKMESTLEFQQGTESKIEQAKLQFLPGWRDLQQGNIRAGGKLIIEYDPERLPRGRTNFRGALFGDIEVNVKFHPGEQFYSGSVLEQTRDQGGRGMVVSLVPKGYEVLVPIDASEVELWFRGFYQTTTFYEEWDSRYGKNYWYQVVQK
jgi:hypothetical protein